ncbi:MAG: CotH kinase family protein [Oscillospiraceae bacterium]
MSTSKYFNRICAAVMVLCLAVVLLMYFPNAVGIEASSKTIGYETRIFDTSYVHTIDIVMDGWDSFIESCENEDYAVCSAVIDGEAFKNIAIRAKGNSSLSQVSQYGNNRYSFKLEFDHYSDSLSYYGLDKLSLNNIIQDSSYMKDYLCYTMMNSAGIAAPLCSFAYITVNGEDWGLYLAVEAIEDSFLERNYGSTGNLYKPDSSSMGGGRGNGQNFDQEDFEAAQNAGANADNTSAEELANGRKAFGNGGKHGGFAMGMDKNDGFGKGGGMGSDDVKLIYSDDSFESYANIFDNAKTDISDSDKTRLINSLKILNSDDAASTVDTNAVIRYFAVHNFVCNFDSYTGSMIHNYYLYENDGILSMIPWDYNLAFGSFMGGGSSTDIINFPIDTPVSGGDTDSRPMLAWIFADEEYTARYHEIFSEFIAEYFESGYFAEEFDRVSALIAPYVEKDPTKFCTYDEFNKGVTALKQLCLLRAESVRGQLDGSIPSTSEGQSSDSSALIDGSSVSINDTGSAGGGANGGKMFGRTNQNGADMQPSAMPDDNFSDSKTPQFSFGENTSSEQNGSSAEISDPSNSDSKTPPQSEENNPFGQNAAPPEMTNGEMPQFAPDENGFAAQNEAPPEMPVNGDLPFGWDNNAAVQAQQNDTENADGGNISNRPEPPAPDQASADFGSNNVLMPGISAAVLVAAILFTKLFKNRI